MNVEHRTSNIERRINVFYLFKIRLSEAIPSFVIRYSAVRFFIFVKFHASAASGRERPVKSKKKLHWNLINLIMAIYEILIVGAASSRDYAMTAIKRFFSRLEAAPTRN
jgi:hypothetical protein